MVTFAKKCWNIGSPLNFCDFSDFGLPRHPETIWIHSIFACWRFLMKFHEFFYEKRKTKKRTWQKWFYRRLRSIFDEIFLRKMIFVKISRIFFKNVNMQKGHEFLWVLDDFWSKIAKWRKWAKFLKNSHIFATLRPPGTCRRDFATRGGENGSF